MFIDPYDIIKIGKEYKSFTNLRGKIYGGFFVERIEVIKCQGSLKDPVPTQAVLIFLMIGTVRTIGV